MWINYVLIRRCVIEYSTILFVFFFFFFYNLESQLDHLVFFSESLISNLNFLVNAKDLVWHSHNFCLPCISVVFIKFYIHATSSKSIYEIYPLFILQNTKFSFCYFFVLNCADNRQRTSDKNSIFGFW